MKPVLSRNRFVLALIVVIVVCSALVVLLKPAPKPANSSVNATSNTTPSSNQAATTPTDSSAIGYSFNAPSPWVQSTSAQSNFTVLTSIQNGVQYTFRISPPGQINPEGKANLTQQTDSVTYAGRPYYRVVWKTNGQAFHITAFPQDDGANNETYYVMVMDFQPGASIDYLSVFDQIAKTLKY